jgi:hypothetical protein
MKRIVADVNQIAYCGLYCGACKKFLNEKCPGCHENEKATWCKVRTCCQDNTYKSCADCEKFDTPADCKKLNNIVAKLFSIIFRSDRGACLSLITEKGYDHFAQHMANSGKMSIKK